MPKPLKTKKSKWFDKESKKQEQNEKGCKMRIDKFLNSTNVLKSRKISQDMCASGVIEVNGVVAKSSKEVKVGDKITLRFLDSSKTYQVLEIPTTKTIPKAKSSQYALLIS